MGDHVDGPRRGRQRSEQLLSRRRSVTLLAAGFGGLLSLSACRGAAPATDAQPARTSLTEAAPPRITATSAQPAVQGSLPPAQSSGLPPALPPAQAQTLRLLFWQAPTILNPHFGRGLLDYAAARCCLEPLLTVDDDGRLIPVLAADVPSAENGGLPDERTVIYRLRPGVVWADGQPFTAEDVVFTYQFIVDPQTAATTGQAYRLLERVEALDPLTVRLTFRQPTAGWYVPFVGQQGLILPRHALVSGAGARSAPFNERPFGTGPYRVEEFKPGDLATLTANPNFRDAGRTFFTRLHLKGGGDSVTAARTVLQTGEYDFAPLLQLESDVLEELDRTSSSGQLIITPGGGTEMIVFNQADPAQEVEGERSHPATRHPFLTDSRVREALALAIDRSAIGRHIIGRAGEASANILTVPQPLASPNLRIEHDLGQAQRLLDAAGFGRGPDGIRRTPAGQRMTLLFSASSSGQRQKIQAVVKDGWQQLGVETEIRSVVPSAFFGSADNPESAVRFHADAQMFLVPFTSPFPAAFMRRYYAGSQSENFAIKSNAWTGTNILKWRDPEYDRLYEQVLVERDPDRGRMLWQQLNDVLVTSRVVIPVTSACTIAATARGLLGPAPRIFDAVTWNIATWRR